MGMNVGSSDDELMVEMNTTPLIDVMLVLLIMLIITIPIQTHAVKLDMPVSSPAKPMEKPVVVQIDIAADNGILWNGERLVNREALEKKLTEAAARAPQPEFHIKPNKDAGYEPVAMVLAESQRLGVTKLGIVGSEQFVQ
ncbi:biopolymer transporter ExbD [Chromobacterium sp. Beijing]|uniref:ExbD/TolR family protein n=1 Tax=Chromobacterium sp. Beijing TaxID=2735795 RepID=UPI001F455D90|nr:biopolymer transporter ExbD [Chromobacterium sp. Beijing]UJB30149.1 biopolymer transporter ExbD [Chromobacterium sp. Beijing]UJB31145.1 biopolymer transporter ExbD [Chromobacterium sp. Beijing]